MSLSAEVHVVGPGDVKTWGFESVKVRVAGYVDVLGDRDCSVVGAGEIRFREIHEKSNFSWKSSCLTPQSNIPGLLT
jgi:hypothetical protein